MTKEKINEQIKELEEKISSPNLCLGTASTYTRISGYYRPLVTYGPNGEQFGGWNKGKLQEYMERREYELGFPVASISRL
jgi:hypothetical protein